eukprot:5038050-Pleurochrysis_carterae.AAC.1
MSSIAFAASSPSPPRGWHSRCACAISTWPARHRSALAKERQGRAAKRRLLLHAANDRAGGR